MFDFFDFLQSSNLCTSCILYQREILAKANKSILHNRCSCIFTACNILVIYTAQFSGGKKVSILTSNNSDTPKF